MSNLCRVVYKFEERLSFVDMCKIVTLFSEDGYDSSYFAFHSEAIKRDGYDNNFNVALATKDKHNNEARRKRIELNSTSISFYGNDARKSLADYEKVIDVLNKKN